MLLRCADGGRRIALTRFVAAAHPVLVLRSSVQTRAMPSCLCSHACSISCASEMTGSAAVTRGRRGSVQMSRRALPSQHPCRVPCSLPSLCARGLCVQLPMSQKGLSKFHALRPPAISIKDYLQRVAKYAACSGECFVLALVYIDRIIQSNPTFVVNSLNIHRLLITSIMLAAKFFDDQVTHRANERASILASVLWEAVHFAPSAHWLCCCCFYCVRALC